MSAIPVGIIHRGERHRRSMHYVAAYLDMRMAALAWPGTKESGIYEEREKRGVLTAEYKEQVERLVAYWLETSEQTVASPVLVYDFDRSFLWLDRNAWEYARFEQYLPGGWSWGLVASRYELDVLLAPPCWWRDDLLETLDGSPHPLERVAGDVYGAMLDGSGSAALFLELLSEVVDEEPGSNWADVVASTLRQHESLLIGWRGMSELEYWALAVTTMGTAAYVLRLVDLVERDASGELQEAETTWEQELKRLRDRYLPVGWEHADPAPIYILKAEPHGVTLAYRPNRQ